MKIGLASKQKVTGDDEQSGQWFEIDKHRICFRLTAPMQAFETSTEDCGTNVIGPDSNGTLRFSQTYDVKVPKASGKVVLDASCVRKIKNLCNQAKKPKFPFAEVFLGIASLLLGAFLGALIAKVPYALCFASVLSYNICPEILTWELTVGHKPPPTTNKLCVLLC